MAFVRMVFFVVVASVLAVAWATSAPADKPIFLGRRGAHARSSLDLSGTSASDMDFLQELERVAGRERRIVTEGLVVPLEEALRPMYAAMPKDASGNLGPDGVRYVLHRLFVQRHGWLVRGLDSAGEAWNSTSPTIVFREHAGDGVELIFEGRLGNHGFSLRHVAIFAATLESFVHAETLERLQIVYSLMGLSHDQALQFDEIVGVTNTYMMLYVLDMDYARTSPFDLAEARGSVLEQYPSWPDTVQFMHDIRQQVLSQTAGTSTSSWDVALSVVEEAGSKYGRWQDKECRSLKRSLQEIEEPKGSGRVPLANFYGSALTNSSWQFTESMPYLRQLGALDDSDPARMAVLIPNYINSPANCLAGSKYYSVCCIDECDQLLTSLEEGLGGVSEAAPERIVEFVSALTSDSVGAPRSITASLVSRLNEIALHHGGLVPLHGRLFAQWLHRAYPLECPFPHLSGTTSPKTALAWMTETGEEVMASEEEMRMLLRDLERPGQEEGDVDQLEIAWSSEEELFVSRPLLMEERVPASVSNARQSLLIFAIPASATLLLMRLFGPKGASAADAPRQKFSM